MRFIARVSVLAAAGLMTAGVVSCASGKATANQQEVAKGFTFTAEKGAWPISDKAATWDNLTVMKNGDGLQIDAENASGHEYIRIRLGAGAGKQLATGKYENVRNIDAHPQGPGIQVLGPGFGCDDDYATFTITELTRTDSGTVTRFSADIEHHCEDPAKPALRAKVRFEGAGEG